MNTCPDCNTEFHCGLNDQEPCWCCSLPNIVPLDSKECLCPKCLENKIAKLYQMNYKYEDNLQSERLSTRFLNMDDVKVWAKFLENKECIEFFPDAKFKTPEDRAVFWLEKQLNRYKENKYGLQALLDKNTGEFIGQCGLLLQEVDGKQELEVGYHILRDHWKKGYAIEAAKLFKQYGLKNDQADSIISIIHYQNTRSQNVAIKNGMQKEKETYMDGPKRFYFQNNNLKWHQHRFVNLRRTLDCYIISTAGIKRSSVLIICLSDEPKTRSARKNIWSV